MDKIEVRSAQPRPAAGVPRTAPERAVALIELMGRLSAHIAQEAAAIRANRPVAELTRLAADKQPLALAYEELARLLRVDGAGMAALPGELKERLAAATRALAQESEANARMLRRAGDAQQELVNALVASINQNRQTQPGLTYGRGSGPTPYPGAMRPPAPSMTYNARL